MNVLLKTLYLILILYLLICTKSSQRSAFQRKEWFFSGYYHLNDLVEHHEQRRLLGRNVNSPARQLHPEHWILHD